jgi:hypothetical protein
MYEINTGGGFIHFLATAARRPNEFFFDILLVNAESGHPFLKPPVLFFAHRK